MSDERATGCDIPPDNIDPREVDEVIATINGLIERVANPTVRDLLEDVCFELASLVDSRVAAARDEEEEEEQSDDDYDDEDEDYDDDDDYDEDYDEDEDEDFDEDLDDEEYDDEDEEEEEGRLKAA